MNHISIKYLLIPCLCWGVSGHAQNYTQYTDLYTNATFVKTIDHSKPVGVIDGCVGNNVSGAATYSINVVIPPGTNGMVPSLKIEYNSQGGNGMLGIGWKLEGIPAIYRVGNDLYHDGFVNPVTFSSDNRFAFNGLRLIKTNNGAYGADGTTYATEAETFSTITSFGNYNGPLWFKVVTKDGLTMEFGNSDDSRLYGAINNANDVVIAWRLNRTYDLLGNYVEYIYNNNDIDKPISQILYTGNNAQGILPYNVINFYYSIRIDKNKAYIDGSPVLSKYLLDNIQISTEGNTFCKKYTFNYATDNLYSYLKEIIESGSDNTSLNSTIFKYGDKPYDQSQRPSNVISSSTKVIIPGDYNGDGLSDFVEIDQNTSPNTFTLYQNTHSVGLFIQKSTGTLPQSTWLNYQNLTLQTSNHTFIVSDFNGDGLDDFTFCEIGGLNIPPWIHNFLTNMWIYYSNPDGSFSASSYSPPPVNSFLPFSQQFFFQGDFDGDGRMDFLTILCDGDYNNPSYYTYLTLPSKNILNQLVNNGGWAWSENDHLFVGDFDGDGMSEFMVIDPNNLCQIYKFSDHGTIQMTLSFTSNSLLFTDKLYFGDFNGDGKCDAFVKRGNDWKLFYSTGKGFVEGNTFSFNEPVDLSSDQIVLSDFNGDGKTDILHAQKEGDNSTIYNVYYSNGNSFKYNSQSFGLPLLTDALISADFDGDGRKDILDKYSNTMPYQLQFFGSHGTERLLQKIANGFNSINEFSYHLMSDGQPFYNQGAITNYPLNNVQYPMFLVYSIKTPDGIGGDNISTFNYSQAQFHRAGLGFIGFSTIKCENNVTGKYHISQYSIDPIFFKSYLSEEATFNSSDDQLISSTLYHYGFNSIGNNRFYLSLNKSDKWDAIASRFFSSTFTYDSYGNVLRECTNNNNTETTEKVTSYEAHGSSIPNKPIFTTITKSRSGQSNLIKKIQKGFSSCGLLEFEADYWGDPAEIITAFSYTPVGNVKQVNIIPQNASVRTTTNSYDQNGRFLISQTNSMNQTKLFTYDPKWGKTTSITDYSGLTTTFTYDSYGRLSSTALPQGITATTSFIWSPFITNIFTYLQYDQLPGKPNEYDRYDAFGRKTLKMTDGFQGQLIQQDMVYDNRGNIIRTTSPYYQNQTPELTTNYSFDYLNRLVTENNEIGSTTYSYTYSGSNLNVTKTNPAGQSSSIITDACGRTISSTDDGGTIAFQYDSDGNEISVTKDNQLLIEQTFDKADRLIQKKEVDAGITHYSYDGLGQLITKTTQNGSTNYTYNILGNITSRYETEGTTQYIYSTHGQDINKISEIDNFSGDNDYFTYDSFGRLSIRKKTIDSEVLTSSYTYNMYDDVISITYPSGFVIKKNYDSHGFLKSITLPDNSATMPDNPIPIYQVNGMNAYNQCTSYTLGDGRTTQTEYKFGKSIRFYSPDFFDYNMVFDYTTGNLTNRSDMIYGPSENFIYDNLNRLTSSNVDGQNGITVAYTLNGNIQQKSDVGIYAYDNQKIHAVNRVTNSNNLISDQIQKVYYTTFDQPTIINEGSYSLEFTYGSDHNRIKTVRQCSGVVDRTRYYFGNYEKNVYPSGDCNEVHYICGLNGIIAIMDRKAGLNHFFYIYKDHLGSIIKASDNSGAMVAVRNFDAWGNKRNGTFWTDQSSRPPSEYFYEWLYRGFCSQEELPEFNLINLNGRLYDPRMGRMLSPDHEIQSTTSTQAYNSYSYCLNNPLKYLDPTGFDYEPPGDPPVDPSSWIPPLTPPGNIVIQSYAENLSSWSNITNTNNFSYGIDWSSMVNYTGTTNIDGTEYPMTATETSEFHFKTTQSTSATEVVTSSEYSTLYSYSQTTYIDGVQVTSPPSTIESKVSWEVRQSIINGYAENFRENLAKFSALGTISTGSGVIGDMGSMSNATFRLTNGIYNGSLFSPKFYLEGWRGGSIARITTYGVSKVAGALSNVSTVLGTGVSYYEIYKGNQGPFTYSDALIGSGGLVAKLSQYYNGVEIPFVGEFMIVYGTARLTWDFFYDLGYNYGPSSWFE